MKFKFNPGWFLLLALAISALITLAGMLLNLLHIRGFFYNLVMGFIVALPLSFMVKPKKL